MADEFDRSSRLSFMKIDARTKADLVEFSPILERNLEAILDKFYAHATSVPELARMFEGTGVISKARQAQSRHWLGMVFKGDFDDAYMRSVSTIGKTHDRIGLEPRWYIAGYTAALNEIIALVIKSYSDDLEKASQTIQSINKAIMLDMEIAISVYIQAAKNQLYEYADAFERNVKTVVDGVASAAAEMQATAQSLTATADQARDGANAVASASEELTASITEISGQVSNSSSMSSAAVESAQASNEKVQGLSDASQSIGDVAELISKIAAQTNLLALNATIEAARAGEAGKGFAVVAQEVKSLATQTANATGDITSEINSIQGATKETVDVISKIADTISQLDEIAATIAAAVEQQGAATSEVTQSIAAVSISVNETGNVANEALSAASELAEQAEYLKVEVNDFLEQIRSS